MAFFSLDAHLVYTQNDGETVMIGFARDPLDPNEYILLQRALHPLTENARLQPDGVYIEVNSQRFSGYGGVRSISLSQDLVTISLDAVAADALRIERAIHIQLSNATFDLDELRGGMEVLCRQAVKFVNNPRI
jgi:hypothetical protein